MLSTNLLKHTCILVVIPLQRTGPVTNAGLITASSNFSLSGNSFMKSYAAFSANAWKMNVQKITLLSHVEVCISYIYRPRMREGNVFIMCMCLFVCVSLCRFGYNF